MDNRYDWHVHLRICSYLSNSNRLIIIAYTTGEKNSILTVRKYTIYNPIIVLVFLPPCGRIGMEMNKKLTEYVEQAYRLAVEYEDKYRCEAQQVLAAVQDILGIRNDTLVKAAMALSGGIAMSHEGTCGALSAGVLAINSVYGRERKDFARRPIDSKSNRMSKELLDRFVREYGSPVCYRVQEKLYGRVFHFVSKEGFVVDRKEMEDFEAVGGHSISGCLGIIGNTAKWTVEIMLNAGFVPGLELLEQV
jgi:hypothetical protein